MRKRVVITGGDGFIGQSTIPALNELGFDVHLFGRTPKAEGCVRHAVDLMNMDATNLLMEIAPTHLLHLAWYAEHGSFWTAPQNLDWVAASLRLTRGFQKAGGKRAVYAGTCAEYDWSSETLDEVSTPLKPTSLYAQAKASLYQLLISAAPHLGLSIAWGRIFNPYGARDKSGRLLSAIIDGIAAGREIDCSPGLQSRDFIHVDDLGRAFAALLDSDVEGGVNLGTGDIRSVREFSETAAEIAGGAHLLRIGAKPMQDGEPMTMWPTLDRLRRTGFTPKLTLRQGIDKSVRERLCR